MTKYLQNYDGGGGSNGTGLTTGNTGGGLNTAFTAVDAASVFSSAQKKDGTLSALLPSTGVTGIQRWAITATRTIRYRVYLFMTAAHTADYIIFDARTGTNTTDRAAMLLLTGANQLRLRAYGSGSAVTVWTLTNTFPLNQWVRVEIEVEQGVSTNDGRASFAMFAGDSDVAIEDSGWITGLNLRGATAQLSMIYIGKVLSDVYAGSVYQDAVELHGDTDYAPAYIGPLQVPLATPTGLTFTPSSSAVAITAAWGVVSGAANYELNVQVKTAGTWGDLNTFVVTGTSRVLTATDGLVSGGLYRARVRAMP